MIQIIAIIIVSAFIVFSACAFIGINIAYNKVFSRADYSEYNTDYFYTYDEIDKEKYPRELLSIRSGTNMLTGYLYGLGNTQGLIIVSPGHRDANDIKLPDITYFVDHGWMVLCYDYTGCYKSKGKSMVGYVQAPADLDAVLTYVENDNRFAKLPVLLFGHSLGAYASAAVLQYKHNVSAVLAASGFDDPKEQWEYSIKRFTGIAGGLLAPYAGIMMDVKFGKKAHFSAIDGINSTDIPVLLLSGTTDEYYGNVSSIYVHRDRITNPKCTIRLMDKENHHGHYDYFLTDAAVQYQNNVKAGKVSGKINKFLYLEEDPELMDYINEFYLNAISKH